MVQLSASHSIWPTKPFRAKEGTTSSTLPPCTIAFTPSMLMTTPGQLYPRLAHQLSLRESDNCSNQCSRLRWDHRLDRSGGGLYSSDRSGNWRNLCRGQDGGGRQFCSPTARAGCNHRVGKIRWTGEGCIYFYESRKDLQFCRQTAGESARIAIGQWECVHRVWIERLQQPGTGLGHRIQRDHATAGGCLR